MIGGAGAVAVAGGGWYFFLRGSSGPEAVVEDFYSALDDGDVDRADDLVHADSPIRPLDDPEGEMDDFDLSVESTEVVEEDIPYDVDDHDTVQEFKAVEAEISVSGEFFGQEIDETETGVTIVAQNTDGDWKIWEDV